MAIQLIPTADSDEGRALVRQATQAPTTPGGTFGSAGAFDLAIRGAKALATSTIVPEHYRGNPGNCLIALELAARIGCPVFMVMQNTHIIEGKPVWASSFIIAMINHSGEFSRVRFKFSGTGTPTSYTYEYWDGPKGQREKKQGKLTAPDLTCTAWARELATGDVLEGTPVSVAMAVAEGWYARSGSKWKTMLEQMLSYRAATFWARLYAPHLIAGMSTTDEREDDAVTAPLYEGPALTNGRGNDGTHGVLALPADPYADHVRADDLSPSALAEAIAPADDDGEQTTILTEPPRFSGQFALKRLRGMVIGEQPDAVLVEALETARRYKQAADEDAITAELDRRRARAPQAGE